MKKAIIIFISIIITFTLVITAASAESSTVPGETSVIPYESEGIKNKELEWLYYVIGFATVAGVIGAAVYISKKR